MVQPARQHADMTRSLHRRQPVRQRATLTTTGRRRLLSVAVPLLWLPWRGCDQGGNYSTGEERWGGMAVKFKLHKVPVLFALELYGV